VSPQGVSPREGFAGWTVVAAAFMVLFVVYGLQFSFGTFVDAVSEDTGWSEGRIQLIFAFYVFGYSALSAVSGHLTDRLGPSRVVGIGAVILSIGYLLWAGSSSLWMVLLGLGIVAPIGMSASWVPCNATVVRWFVQRRGLALALTTAGGSLANILVPPLAAVMIETWGWRTALRTMAIIGGVVMVLASTRMLRDPESIGQHPDGIASTVPASEEFGLTPGDAMRTRAYWQILVMYALSFTVVFVPFVHISRFAVDLGVGSVTAATVISAIGVGGLLGRLIAGPASDTFGRTPVAVTAFGLETLAFLAMAAAPGLGLLYPAAIGFGLAYGATVTLLPALVGDHFGRAHAGSIVGRVFATAGAMAAVGPYVAQLLVEALDSFRLAFALSGGANAAALLLAMRLPAPANRTQRTSESETTAR
jgi:MFS family permease